MEGGEGQLGEGEGLGKTEADKRGGTKHSLRAMFQLDVAGRCYFLPPITHLSVCVSHSDV